MDGCPERFIQFKISIDRPIEHQGYIPLKLLAADKNTDR